MTLAEEICDQVAFIVDGRIAAIDAPRALRLRYGRPMVRVEYGQNGLLASEQFALAGLAENDAFQQRLRSGTVQTIHSQEATLEEVFVRVTGRSLS